MTTTIIPARERAQAPIGCAYVAPLFWNKWFRWDGSRASGHYQLGERTQDEHHTGLQVLQMASGIRSRHLPLIGASRGRPVRSRTFWERRLEHEA